MREFSKISPALWRSKRFTGLKTSDDKLVFLYLLTCEHQNSAGAFRLPAGYAATDLKMTADAFEAARDSLVEAELVAFDQDTDEYVVLRWFKHNPPMNEKHRMGIVSQLERLDSEHLVKIVMASLDDDETQALEAAERPTDPSNGYGYLTESHLLKRGRR